MFVFIKYYKLKHLSSFMFSASKTAVMPSGFFIDNLEVLRRALHDVLPCQLQHSNRVKTENTAEKKSLE